MAYEYQALTGFELTVAENEVVSILEEEDSEGWIKVRTSDHREGLIPASYIRNDESRDETVEQENLGEGSSFSPFLISFKPSYDFLLRS